MCLPANKQTNKNVSCKPNCAQQTLCIDHQLPCSGIPLATIKQTQSLACSVLPMNGVGRPAKNRNIHSKFAINYSNTDKTLTSPTTKPALPCNAWGLGSLTGGHSAAHKIRLGSSHRSSAHLHQGYSSCLQTCTSIFRYCDVMPKD